MINPLSQLWSAPVRAGPVIVGVLLFALINGVRRWFHIQYTPTYFVIFPVSLLNRDVAHYTGMGPVSAPESESERRILKRRFLAKAVLAGAITFVVIPVLLGLLDACYMAASEFIVTLSILLL